MFGDVGQARTNAAMLPLPIATTSSHTCTKPIVVGSQSVSTESVLLKIVKTDQNNYPN